MKRYLSAMILAVVIGILCSAERCRAEIAGDNAFDHAQWNLVYEELTQKEAGVVQSICATEDYIITIENTSDASNEPDVVSAYYRNAVNETGDPVEQYSLARRSENMDWEHGNGMAYNPGTGEIYVALYTNKTPETRGCIWVMDPATLEYKRSIKISDTYNILGIGYKEDTNQYVIQTNTEGGYSFKILDENFQIVEDLGEYADTAEGDNFQDLYVSGDYIINFPLTFGMGIGDFIHMYSISKRSMVGVSKLDFQFQNVTSDEPEGLIEIEPGKYMAVVNVTLSDGSRRYRFYTTDIPYYFNVSASADNGTVSASSQKVLRGEDVELQVEAEKGFELASTYVNGEEKATQQEKSPGGFLLKNVQNDSQLKFVFIKTPVNIRLIVWSAILFVSLAALTGWYCLMIHIKRERNRKRARARIARQRAMWQDEY